MFMKLAFLNMRRHLRRTVLILFAIAVSVAVMETLGGMMEGMRANFFSTLTNEGAHLTLYARGWKAKLDQFSLAYRIEDPDAIIARLSRDPRLVVAEKVMNFGALLVADDKNIGLSGIGIGERTAYFANIAENVASGSFPPTGDGIVVSRKVAEALGLSLNDKLLVLTQDSQDSPFYLECAVSGIYESASADFDSSHFFVSHLTAEKLLYLPGQTTEIRVRLKDPNDAEAFAADLRNYFRDRGLESETWREANGSLLSMLGMFDFFMAFMNLFIVIVAASVIINAILMNVFERMREFATLRAIGLKRKSMGRIILTEGFLQGLAGGVIGLALGIPIVLFFQKHGLDWGEMSDLMGVGNVVNFKFTPGRSLADFVSGIAIALTSSFYAAGVGGKLSILDGLAYH